MADLPITPLGYLHYSNSVQIYFQTCSGSILPIQAPKDTFKPFLTDLTGYTCYKPLQQKSDLHLKIIQFSFVELNLKNNKTQIKDHGPKFKIYFQPGYFL